MMATLMLPSVSVQFADPIEYPDGHGVSEKPPTKPLAVWL
jgi:hypothetical protein